MKQTRNTEARPIVSPKSSMSLRLDYSIFGRRRDKPGKSDTSCGCAAAIDRDNIKGMAWCVY